MSPPPAFSRIASAAAAIWRGGQERHGRGGWALIVSLVVFVIAALIYLVVGESPWERGILAKLSDKQELTINDTISAGLWLGSLVNLVIAVSLLVLHRQWAAPLPKKPADETGEKVVARPGGAGWFWIAIFLAVAAAAILRAPRLTHSFWNDEEQGFRKFTWGEYEPPKKVKTGESPDPDALAFDPAGWDRALFYSVNGNNHVVHTIAAKVCHSVWRQLVRPKPEVFREWVIRLEPLTSSLLSIIVLAAWLRRSGFPIAGATAAWVLALHPWAMRYAVEARGYSAMLLFILLTLWCAGEAMRTGRWKWWLGFGLGQCAYLLCFAGAVYLAVAMNALLFGWLAMRRDRNGLWRWLVACALGAMIFLQIMTATVLRIWNWIQAPHVEPFPMDGGFARDFWAHLCLGIPWSAPEPGKHFGADIATLAAGSPLWSTTFFVILPLLLAAGLAIAFIRSRDARFLLATLALTAVLIVWHNAVAELAFYGWYAQYFMLGFAVALGFAADIGKKIAPAPVRAVASVGLLCLYAWLAARPLDTIRSHDRHPMRQAVAAARGETPAIDRRHAAVLTAAVGSGANQIRTYDPRVRWIKTTDDLENAIQTARASAKPLVIYACGLSKLRQDQPGLAAILDHPGQFEPGEYLPGQEAFWSFQLFRLIPARD